MGKFFTSGSDVIYIPWNLHTLAARLWEEKYLSNLLLVVSTEDASVSFIPEIIHAQRRRFTQELCTNRPAPTYTQTDGEEWMSCLAVSSVCVWKNSGWGVCIVISIGGERVQVSKVAERVGVSRF